MRDDRTPLTEEMVKVLEEASKSLRPFASHIGKDGELITLKIGKDTWTRTLFTEDFDRARETSRNIHALLSSVGKSHD